MRIRKFIRDIHRDFGYVFFAMTVIYGVSGIALNHINDWNPNYIVKSEVVYSDLTKDTGIDKDKILSFLSLINERDNYKKHYFPSDNKLKIFINNGSVLVDIQTGEAHIEKITRRPVFYQLNYLHYNNPRKLFTWFSDIFAVSLILLAITGLFMVKGKNGITRRGAWLTLLGIILPLIFYLISV
jgi:hypothetical protein